MDQGQELMTKLHELQDYSRDSIPDEEYLKGANLRLMSLVIVSAGHIIKLEKEVAELRGLIESK